MNGEIKMNELYHHGVKGQKWGVRRYQNADGSLTTAGMKKAAAMRRKYTKLSDSDPNYGYSRKGTNMKIKYKNLTGKNISRYPISESSQKTQKLNKGKKPEQKKSMDDLSNEELIQKTNRMNLEKNYLDAKRNLSSINPKQESAGKKFIQHVGRKIIVPAVTEGSKRALQNYAQAWIQKKLGVKIKKDIGPEIIDEIMSEFKNEAKQETNATNNTKNKDSKKSSNEKSNDEPLKGTVEGKGTSKRSEGTSNDFVDAEWREVNDSNIKNGSTFVNQFLLEDKNRK